MNEENIRKLIEKAVIPGKQAWADLGSGEGAFTLGLRELAGPEVEIYSIDKNGKSLSDQEKKLKEKFPDTNIHYIVQNFNQNLDLPQLDGILMANSLHYVKDQVGFLQDVKKFLKNTGKLLLVEYNITFGTPWVPHPLSFKKLEQIAPRAGFAPPELLATVSSHFQREMYSAQTRKI